MQSVQYLKMNLCSAQSVFHQISFFLNFPEIRNVMSTNDGYLTKVIRIRIWKPLHRLKNYMVRFFNLLVHGMSKKWTSTSDAVQWFDGNENNLKVFTILYVF